MTGPTRENGLIQWYTICQVMDVELIQLGIPERFATLVRDEFIVNFVYDGLVVERPYNWIEASSNLFNGMAVSSVDWETVVSNWSGVIRLWAVRGYGRQYFENNEREEED
ncbi:unnamed protein product [Auanema sp. JU1783]|nr:unnamed protein product [Auanema sp. JU1783]